ncbi:YkyA family protein [Neobacillus niacini]|uniref:YkyA family protein n=1 Tax=Neobacillus niacini TaxID=86668 RepID=UPI002FFDB1FE
MSIFRFTRIILFVFAGSIILAGCMNKEPAAEKMYQVLEKVVEAEKEFENQQQPLVALEKQEQEIYNQIMTLGMKQHNEIVNLSNEALSMIEERRVLLQKEINSINASKTEFKKAEAIKNEIKVPEQKKKAEELLEIMTNRYKVHSQLSKEYLNALDSDKELYTMLKNEGISFDKLEEHVTKLNTAYQQVFEKNEKFNDLTAQYNVKKLEFYKEAGLKLQTEE